MRISTIDESQRKTARVLGFTYLFTMTSSVFPYYLRGQLIVFDRAHTELIRMNA